MLLKGLDDVRLAPSPLLAAEMVLVRLAYAADLPPPSELARRHAETAIAETTATTATRVSLEDAPALAAVPETSAAPASFAEAVALFERRGEPMLHGWLYQTAQLVHFEPGRIELRPVPGAPPDLFGRAAAALGRWTGRPWLVALADDGRPAEPTLAEQAATALRSRTTLASSRSCSIFRVRPWSTCARPLPAERASPTRRSHEESRQHAQAGARAPGQDGRHAGQVE
jgi:DNA polymerase-3 subunit gamma/tau